MPDYIFDTRDVHLTGTLGILIALVRDNTLPLTEANDLLAAMIQRRYRSPVDRLDELIWLYSPRQ